MDFDPGDWPLEERVKAAKEALDGRVETAKPMEGVWAAWTWDTSPILLGVYYSELAACRAALEYGGGAQAEFLKWGQRLGEST